MTNEISEQMKSAVELSDLNDLNRETNLALVNQSLRYGGMDLNTIRENQDVYQSLNKEGAGLNDTDIQSSNAKELFNTWLQYNGIIGYSSDIRNALWTLITASPRYLVTTDHEKEEWLKSMLGLGTDPA